MKALLVSIKPKYVADILNGHKTIEIRKSYPKCELPIDVYIYCTKDNKQRLYPVALLDKSNQVFKRAYREDKIDNRVNYLNGKVVAKFTLKKVDEFVNGCKVNKKSPDFNDYKKYNLLNRACLSEEELYTYAEDLSFYAWHIDNLEIFDKPKELSEFIQSKRKNYEEPTVQKAPQSWCYIEVDE